MRTGLLAFALIASVVDEPPAPRLRSGGTIPYPRDAKTLQVVGDVVFVARFDEEGKVTRVDVRQVPMRGVGFEATVQETVKKWRFAPAVVDGQPRAGEHVGRVTFSLRLRDEGDIVETVARFARAWNSSDAAAFAATFEPDEGLVRTAFGTNPKGHDAIRGWASTRFTAARPLLVTKWAGLHFYDADKAMARVPIDGLHRDVYLMLTRTQGAWFVRSLDDAALVGTIAVPEAPRHVGDAGVEEPRKVKGVAPVYPDDLKMRGIQGTVILECVISVEGEVTDLRAVSGPPELYDPAAAAVRQWRYTPTVVDGRPVPVGMTITVTFRLK